MLFSIYLNSNSFSSFTHWSVMFRGSHSLTDDICWDATLQNSIKLIQVDDNSWRVFGITSFCVCVDCILFIIILTCVDCILFIIILTACYSQVLSSENISLGIPKSSLEHKIQLYLSFIFFTLFTVIRSPRQYIS